MQDFESRIEKADNLDEDILNNILDNNVTMNNNNSNYWLDIIYIFYAHFFFNKRNNQMINSLQYSSLKI